MSIDFDDISDIETIEDDLILNDSDFDGVMNDTTRESISINDLDLTNDSLNLSDMNNIEEDDELSNNTTKESELTFEGGKKKRTRRKRILKKRRTYKKRYTKKIHKNHKNKSHKKRHNKKTRKMRRKNMIGRGDIDSLYDADFNANLAIDKKSIGGSKQYGGRNVGFNCFDPNFSIYNTRSLQLFPYNPEK